MMGWNGMGFGMGWAWLFGLLMLVGLVLLVVLLVRVLGGGVTGSPQSGNRAQDGPRPGRAREILDERYARGEMTTDEYRERLTGLGEGP